MDITTTHLRKTKQITFEYIKNFPSLDHLYKLCSDCSAMQTEAGAESTKPVHEQHVPIQPVSAQPPTTDPSPLANAAHATKETARMQQMFHDLSLSSIEKHAQIDIDSSAAGQVEIQSLKQENKKLKIEQEKAIKIIGIFVPPSKCYD